MLNPADWNFVDTIVERKLSTKWRIAELESMRARSLEQDALLRSLRAEYRRICKQLREVVVQPRLI